MLICNAKLKRFAGDMCRDVFRSYCDLVSFRLIYRKSLYICIITHS